MSKFDANAAMAAAETKSSEELTELLAEIDVLAGTAIETIGDIVTAIDNKKKATTKEKLTEARRAKEKLTRVIAGLENGSNARADRQSQSRQQRPQPEPAPVATPEPKPAEAPVPVAPVATAPEPKKDKPKTGDKPAKKAKTTKVKIAPEKTEKKPRSFVERGMQVLKQGAANAAN